MKPTTLGITAVFGGLLLLGFAFVETTDLDAAAFRGAGIGAVLGILNLIAGLSFARSSIKGEMDHALKSMVFGFFARGAILIGLVLWFGRIEAIDATGFALSFMAFFLVYLMLEVRMIDGAMRARRTAS